MRLTEHFTLEELTVSETAARCGIDNTPSQDILPNLRYLSRQLEAIRAAIGKPIHVNSGFRCLEVNGALGSKPTSAHIRGLAADIIAPQFGTAFELCKAVAALEDLNFDQVIYEFRSWCHVGFCESGSTPRQQLLTIISAKTGYQAGLLNI